MHVLDEKRGAALRSLCDLIVPGSERIWPEVYIDARIAKMDEPDRAAVLASIDALAPAAAGGTQALAAHALSGEFALIRSLACEAFYGDFVAPGAPGPGGWTEIDFAPPLAARLNKDWSYLGVEG